MMNRNSMYLYFICLIATMGGLMFGFDVGIISGAVPFIQPYFGWNELQLGWGVSSLLVGAIIGAFGSGILSDKYGRKNVLIIVALFFAVSCTFTALASSSVIFWLSCRCRFSSVSYVRCGSSSAQKQRHAGVNISTSHCSGNIVFIYNKLWFA